LPQQYEAPELVRPLDRTDHRRGPENAPIVLVEYGDFECPYCRDAYAIVKEIRHKLGDRLCFAYRHFPVTQIHPHAMEAAEAAEAAAAQGKFWEMYDLLFTHQHALENEDLKRYASDLNLDRKTFDQQLDDHLYADSIHEQFMEGVHSGVNGTPAFFINGARYDGPHQLDPLLEALERSSKSGKGAKR
jgi:protein-disulfide isomerase